MIPRSIACVAGALLLVVVVAGCESPASKSHAARPLTVVLDEKGAPEGIEHYRKWSEKLGQGAQPEGEVAFRNLAALGYRNVLSVDGSRPDLENAAKYGLRYVHVPIEYAGITRDQELRIVQAIRTSVGPVFVHCHHGLHRGPAGAAIARMAVDGVSNAQAGIDLKASGCAPKYEGLYRDIAAFVPPTEAEMANVPADLPSYASPGDFVEHMVAADQTLDRLQNCEKAGWAAPAGEPDVTPAHQAVILGERFREMLRLDEVKSRDARFQGWLAESESAAGRVEAAVRAGNKDEATAALAVVKKACGTCHASYRDK